MVGSSFCFKFEKKKKRKCQYSFMSRQLSEYNENIKQSFNFKKCCPDLTLFL